MVGFSSIYNVTAMLGTSDLVVTCSPLEFVYMVFLTAKGPLNLISAMKHNRMKLLCEVFRSVEFWFYSKSLSFGHISIAYKGIIWIHQRLKAITKWPRTLLRRRREGLMETSRKNYDTTSSTILGKANVVAEALSSEKLGYSFVFDFHNLREVRASIESYRDDAYGTNDQAAVAKRYYELKLIDVHPFIIHSRFRIVWRFLRSYPALHDVFMMYIIEGYILSSICMTHHYPFDQIQPDIVIWSQVNLNPFWERSREMS
ncbi:hypothetical protein Tco_0574893 [Tanacetum coccineum]